MRINHFKLHRLKIPFQVSFEHNLNSSTAVESLLLETHACADSELEGQRKNHIGIGECIPRSYVTGESTDEIVKKISNVLPELIRAEFNHVNDITSYLDNLISNHDEISGNDLCLRALIELSLLETLALTRNCSVTNLLVKDLGLEVNRQQLIYSTVLGARSIEKLKKLAYQSKKLGLTQVKLKVTDNNQLNYEMLKTINEVYGGSINLRVDANQALNITQVLELYENSDSLGIPIQSFEEPLNHADIFHYKELIVSSRDRFFVILDESCCSQEDLNQIEQEQLAHGINIRISKNGGLLNALKLAKMASESGLQYQLGAQVGETSVLSRAGQIFGRLVPQECLYHEGSFGKFLLKKDVAKNQTVFGMNGKLDPTEYEQSTGWGLNYDMDSIQSLSLASLEIS